MKRARFAALALIFLLASCAAPGVKHGATTSPPRGVPPAPPQTFTRQPEIRFALVGEPRDVNVWALFAGHEADYSSYAVMNDYWPRLYTLSLPGLTFTERAAEGRPSPFTQRGSYYTSAVGLRPDLKWTDGTLLTARDVAFTVNAALAFELGFDWNSFYSPESLDHVEVINATTMRFHFKRPPNVGTWQYGALQGPIVQANYWESKIEDAMALLPDEELRASVAFQRDRIAELQPTIDLLNVQLVNLQNNGRQDQELASELKISQSNLEEANKMLAEYLDRYNRQLEAARQTLYALDDAGEPTLGTWMPGESAPGKRVNQLNPLLPFERPSFDAAVYLDFASDYEALEALQQGRVDVVLSPHAEVSSAPLPMGWKTDLDGSARFLIFNPSNYPLSDPALRQAIACMIWYPARTQTAVLSGFVLPGDEFWRNPLAVTPCADLNDSNLDQRLTRAVDLLKSAGYTWAVEPARDFPGFGLTMPGGKLLPPITLLSLSAEKDPLEAGEAAFIESQVKQLGISLIVEYVSVQEIRYEVYSARKYDLAILGWRLSLYPGYLCTWFGAGGQFGYGGTSLVTECEALAVESDLQAARERIFAIQAILAQNLPFIPLYAPLTYDVFGRIAYPFDNLLGGMNGAYGAPSFAIPAP